MPNDTASPNPSPPPSPDPQVERLQAAVADLQNRVHAIEARIAARARPIRPEDESRFGLTAINRIGAVTLIIGIIFFFKYASENQWIGNGTIVALGVLIGLTLIVAGEWLRRRAEQAFPQGVAGCGLAILYISVYAAFAYYKLISPELGFAGLLLASVLALLLCFRFASPAIAAVGFIGAWVAPLLVPAVGFHFAYLCVWSVVSVLTVTRLYRMSQRESALLLAAFNAFWVLLCAWRLIGKDHPDEFVVFTMVIAAVHFIAAFAARSVLHLWIYLYLCGHACLVTGGLRAIDIWATAEVGQDARSSFLSATDSVFLALYGVFMISYGLLRRSVVNRFLGLTFLALVIVKLYIYDVWQLTRVYRISALFALGVLLLAASYLYSRFKQRTTNHP